MILLNSGQSSLLTIPNLFKIYHNPNISILLGKSHLLKMIANYATDKNLAVCVSAPTGKLAARYKQQLPNCRCNTVHTNFTIPVDEKPAGSVNWSLSDVHVLLIDEVLSSLNMYLMVTLIVHSKTIYNNNDTLLNPKYFSLGYAAE